MRLRDRTLAENGKFCLDIAKYDVTVVVLSSFIKDDVMGTSAKVVAVLVFLVFFFLGNYLLERSGRDASSETISTPHSPTIKPQSKKRRK